LVKASTLGNLPIFNDTITSTVPIKSVDIEKGSTVSFAIKGNAPPEAESDSLAVNVYTIEGKPVKVLKVADELSKTPFTVDLDEGREYILMAIATWFPDDDGAEENIEKITGYSYRVNVLSKMGTDII
jgi:hypothetical protein